jgi:hypothetical protein
VIELVFIDLGGQALSVSAALSSARISGGDGPEGQEQRKSGINNLEERNPDKAIKLACRLLYSSYGISGSSIPIQFFHRSGARRCSSSLVMRNRSRPGLSIT